MKPKSFLTLAELDPGTMDLVLSLSLKFKAARGVSKARPLQGKTVALLFEKPSTRTRVSFQVAVSELGGSSISLGSSEIQLGRGETIEDTARVLSRYVHAIMARVNGHSEVERLAASSTVPVINGLSDLYHPVQILADLLTLRERKGTLKGLKVAWVGDGNNVCNSWLIGAATTGVHFSAATPPGYAPDKGAVRLASSIARGTGASLDLFEDPKVAVRGADCVITDTFVSMGFDKEREKRVQVFLPRYTVDRRMMALAKRDAIFQHCLPAHRGEEVTDEVIDGPNSAVWDEAENRLHTTKALLYYLVLGRSELQKPP
ncbi:MAG: ornithine carbamoyltransferase [Nitrososphaerales archaeon]